MKMTWNINIYFSYLRLRAGRAASLRRVQTDSGTHSASYPMCTGSLYPGREADHSPLSSVEAKNPLSYTFAPPYVFMRGISLSTCLGS
jgi:hypothetical protein